MLVNQLSERNTNSFWLQQVDLQISKESPDFFEWAHIEMEKEITLEHIVAFEFSMLNFRRLHRLQYPVSN